MQLDTRFPHPGPRVLVLGDIFGADRRRPTLHEMELATTLGPIYERKLLDIHLTIVAGGRLAAECNDEQRWARALAGPTLKFREITGSGLFTARTRDPLWAQARHILDPGFAQGALRVYHEAMMSVADDLVASWTANPVVDVHRAMTDATLEVIARAGFSRDLGLFSEAGPQPEVADLLRTLATVLSWASESSNDLPVIGPIRGAWQRRSFAGGLDRVRAYVDGIVADRVAGREPERDDLLGLMLNPADPETGEMLPHDNIRDQVLTFLVAGHETTAALLETVVWYLARHPDLAARVRAEAGMRGFDYAGVAGMKFTRSVLNEALRLWPAVPAYFRTARVDQQLGGYDIPAGHTVLVHALSSQRDTDIWGDDAATFRPDRWEAKALREFPDRFFTPFGTGPRSCIGRAFAMQESALMISRIADAFDLAFADPADDARSAPDMRERGTLRPAPFRLTCTARTRPA
ncbi:cytochrome P450 [Gordonia sp. NPDC003376]